MFRTLLIVCLLWPLALAAQVVTKDSVLQAAADIQKAVEGTDQLRLRVNRYCHVTITHEPEEALLKVISVHVLNQKFEIPASEMLYVIRASVATEGQLLLWSGDCGAPAEKEGTLEMLRLSSEIMHVHRSLHQANERFWNLLAQQIAAEERSALREQ